MRRTLAARTLAAAAVLALVVAGLFYVMVDAIRAERDTSFQARKSDDRITVAIEEQKLVIDLETGLRGYMITGRPGFLRPWNEALDRLPETQGRLEGLVSTDPVAGRVASAIGSDVTDYVDRHGKPLIAAVARGDMTDAQLSAVTAAGKVRVDRIRGRFGSLIDLQQREAATARRHADASSDRAILFGTLGLIGLSLLVILFCAYQVRFVLRPVRRVGSAARRLADGDLTVRVAERGVGEVGDLARAFNNMADSLEHSRDELESQNSELEAQQGELERVIEELAEGKARIEAMYTVGRAISSGRELEDVAQTVVDQLADLAGAELGAVFARTPDGARDFEVLAARGIDLDTLAAVRPGVGLAGRAIAEERLIVAGNGESAVAVETPGGRIVSRHEVHLPLTAGSTVIGVVTLGRLAGGPFLPGDLDLLEYLAGRAGAGLANAFTLRTARDQAALNRAVLDTAAEAFLTVCASGKILAWNPAAERMFGWTADEATGADVIDLVIPQRSRDEIRALLAGERPPQTELDVVHRDGREFPIELVGSPLERNGDLTYNVFARDITERRRADLYMAAHYAVTRVLSEASTIADARGGIVEALARTLGWQVGIAWLIDEEAEVLRPTAIWAAEDVDAGEFTELTQSVTIRRGEPLPGLVWERKEPLWVEDLSRESGFLRGAAARRAGLHAAMSFPVFASNRMIGLVELFSSEAESPDPELLSLLATVGAQIGQFSDRKRAELEADRLKDEFFALVSHELRTPLTSIIGYLELVLEESEHLTPDIGRFLGVVERNSRRLHRLVGDLLFVAQVEAGRLSLDRTTVPLARIVTDAIEAARPRAEEIGVSLGLRADAVGDCEGDADRLGQMLDNLVSNAIKFTPAGGSVDVYLTGRGDHALIEVRDSGVGIPADEQASLFQRFFRSSTATAHAIPGVGLGLTISRAIIEAHGGSVAFESEEGRGTTFRVELPLVQRPSVHEPSHAPREVVL